jgi:hypothetical protein
MTDEIDVSVSTVSRQRKVIYGGGRAGRGWTIGWIRGRHSEGEREEGGGDEREERQELTELLKQRPKLLDVLLVLSGLLDLLSKTLHSSDGSREVVVSSGSVDGGLDDLDGRDQVVGEDVVQSSLHHQHVEKWWKKSATRSSGSSVVA